MIARLYALPIRKKIVLAITHLVALILVFIFLFYPAQLRREAHNTILTKALSVARLTAFNLSPALYFRDEANMEEALAGARQTRDLVYLVLLDEAGEVQVEINMAKAEAAGYRDARRGPMIARGRQAYAVSVPVVFAPPSGTPKPIGELFLGLSLAGLEGRITRIRLASGIVSLAVLALGIVLAFGISAVITRPLEKMTAAVQDIAAGNLARRAEVGSGDEVGHLARCFNVMVDSLEKTKSELKDLNAELEKRIAERTEAERTARQAKEEAEAANRAKSEFLASMSHELRTPLNAVIGFSQILDEEYYGRLNEKQAGYVRDILESGTHLLEMINDVLDLSRIEVGRLDLEFRRFGLRDFLEHGLIMIREKCLKHGIRLVLSVPAELRDRSLLADERRMKQVLFNLLSNAAKFTPDGGEIEVSAAESGGGILFGVRDTGIGVAPEALDKIFEAFFQVKSGIQEKTPGAGLGLSVSRRIVGLHGGRIWAESEGPGRGSRFWAWIPQGRDEDAARGRGSAPAARDDRVESSERGVS